MIKRIQGTFFEKLELYHFPFDVQGKYLACTLKNELNFKYDLNLKIYQ